MIQPRLSERSDPTTRSWNSVAKPSFLSTMAALLARVVRELGRDDEALALTQAAEHAAADHDLDAQVRWRTVRAPILARRGHGQQAEELAREALDLARKTGAPILQADTLFDLAVVQKATVISKERALPSMRRLRCIWPRETESRRRGRGLGGLKHSRNRKTPYGRVIKRGFSSAYQA